MQFKLKTLMLFVCISFNGFLFAQAAFTLSGVVSNHKNEVLQGATIWLNQPRKGAVSKADGSFAIENLKSGTYTIVVSFVGYEKYTQQIEVYSNTVVQIHLENKMQNLHEVTVEHDYIHQQMMQDSRNAEFANETFIRRNLGGSLMQSLDRLPGVGSMSIGSGQSKPAIRGLSFNRIVVTENGMKHEGQQWGTEHGLEVDQFAVENVEIIKGPAALANGSDAIGGVVQIKSSNTPLKNTFGGNVQLLGKTNNSTLGTSAYVEGRKNKLFAKFRATALSYGDFKVPTNNVYIYNWEVPLYKNHVRNTAGEELNFHATAGYVNDHFQSTLYASRMYSKSGMFANAAGLHPLSANEELHDASSRDIQLPRQNVTHYKLIHQNQWYFTKATLQANWGYQRNFRQEWMTYSPENADMPNTFPDDMPYPSTLEKQFDKQVWEGTVKMDIQAKDRLTIKPGLNLQHQNNTIDGKGFLVPDFSSFSAGFYSIAEFLLNEQNKINAGVRYDFTHLKTEDYYEWYAPFRQRAYAMNRTFQNFSWSVGYNYNREHFMVKVNAGKSFRVPQAQELASNGINYHMFRVEKGDSSLRPEIAYQLDVGVEWHNEKLAIGASPFVNYFTNYIYLNPTPGFDSNTNKQIYEYTEAQVMRWGGEFHAHYNVLPTIKLGAISEYVHSTQLSGEKEGFNLPFAPPLSVLLNASYMFKDIPKFTDSFISLDWKWAADQNNIVPPEEITPSYQLVNLSAGTTVNYGTFPIVLNLIINNLFNTKYYNHTSYYRMINMPEPGRNITLNAKFNF